MQYILFADTLTSPTETFMMVSRPNTTYMELGKCIDVIDVRTLEEDIGAIVETSQKIKFCRQVYTKCEREERLLCRLKTHVKKYRDHHRVIWSCSVSEMRFSYPEIAVAAHVQKLQRLRFDCVDRDDSSYSEEETITLLRFAEDLINFSLCLRDAMHAYYTHRTT